MRIKRVIFGVRWSLTLIVVGGVEVVLLIYRHGSLIPDLNGQSHPCTVNGSSDLSSRNRMSTIISGRHQWVVTSVGVTSSALLYRSASKQDDSIVRTRSAERTVRRPSLYVAVRSPSRRSTGYHSPWTLPRKCPPVLLL